MAGSKLFKDSIWSLIGSTIGRGLSLVAGIIVARFLGKEIYGEYGVIKTTLIYIEIFSTFGLGYTATKFIAEYLQKDRSKVKDVCKAALRITMVTSGTMALFLFLFSKQVAVFIDAPHLSSALKISALGIIVNAINIAQSGILSGFAEFKTIARNTSISGVVTFVLTVALTYFFDLDGAVWALVLSYGAQCLINNVSVRKILSAYSGSETSDRQLYKNLLSFSFPIALQESLYSITNWLVSLLLIKLSGYGELGLYSAAGQWAAIISFIPGILRNVTLSHLSSSGDEISSHNKTMNAMLLTNFLSTSLMFAFVAIFAGFICSFYGETFGGLKAVLLLCTVNAIVTSVANVYTQEYMALSRNWFLFFCRILRDAGTLVIGYFLIIRFKEKGAVLVSLAALAANIIYFSVLYFKHRSLLSMEMKAKGNHEA